MQVACSLSSLFLKGLNAKGINMPANIRQGVNPFYNSSRKICVNLKIREWGSRAAQINTNSNSLYYIDTDEIPGFFLLLKNHIFIVRSEDTIFIFHV